MFIRSVESALHIGYISNEDISLTSPSTAAQTSRVQPTSYGFLALAEVLVGSSRPAPNLETRH